MNIFFLSFGIYLAYFYLFIHVTRVKWVECYYGDQQMSPSENLEIPRMFLRAFSNLDLKILFNQDLG